jgi:hypothetical protein
MMGLVAQAVGYASVTSAVPAQMAIVGVTMGCMKATTQTQEQQPDKPCTGPTLDCIAKMGCALSPTLVLPATSDLSGEYREDVPMRCLSQCLWGVSSVPNRLHPHALAELKRRWANLFSPNA